MNLHRPSTLLALAGTIALVIGGLAAAAPILSVSSHSSEDTEGHLSTSKRESLKSVEDRHWVNLQLEAPTGSRSLQQLEGVPPFWPLSMPFVDESLKALGELGFVKELTSIIVPQVIKLLKELKVPLAPPRKGEKSPTYATSRSSAEPDSDQAVESRRLTSGAGDLLADLGSAVFGSKADGSGGLVDGAKLRPGQQLIDLGGSLPGPLGGVISSAGSLLKEEKPVNTINKLASNLTGKLSGTLNSARTSLGPDIGRLLEEALGGAGGAESKDLALKLLGALAKLLDESTFRGGKQQEPQQQQQQEEQQQQQQE